MMDYQTAVRGAFFDIAGVAETPDEVAAQAAISMMACCSCRRGKLSPCCHGMRGKPCCIP